MSVKKEYETITHTVTENVLVRETRYCDVCRKEIEEREAFWKFSIVYGWPQEAEDWEHKDICSDSCMREEFEKYLKDCKEYPLIDVEISRTRL